MRRPDLLVNLFTHSIIVEIDENQHKSYEKSCNDNRNAQLLNDLAPSVVFIRFNPDTYIKNGETVKTPWRTNCKGLYTISKTKLDDWNARLTTLEKTISFHLRNIPDKLITEIQLFFDE